MNKTTTPRITDVLREEHRVIEQVLDALEQLVRRARAGEGFDRQSAGEIVRFVQQFADACHHGKEEDRLFPAMEAKGIPGELGPVGVMKAEHHTGRAAVRAMEAALWEPMDDKRAVERFLGHAEMFVEHLRNHILKEDNIVFPLADSVLSDEEHARLHEEFERVEREDMGEGTHAWFVALADRLADRFGVARARDREPGTFTGCCHQHSESATA